MHSLCINHKWNLSFNVTNEFDKFNQIIDKNVSSIYINREKKHKQFELLLKYKYICHLLLFHTQTSICWKVEKSTAKIRSFAVAAVA